MLDQLNNRPDGAVTVYGIDEKFTARIDEREQERDHHGRQLEKGAWTAPGSTETDYVPEKITAIEALDRAFAACIAVAKDTDSQLVQVTAHSCALAVFHLSRDMNIPPKLPYTAAHAANLRAWHQREVERLDKEAGRLAAEEMKKVGLE